MMNVVLCFLFSLMNSSISFLDVCELRFVVGLFVSIMVGFEVMERFMMWLHFQLALFRWALVRWALGDAGLP